MKCLHMQLIAFIGAGVIVSILVLVSIHYSVLYVY